MDHSLSRDLESLKAGRRPMDPKITDIITLKWMFN